MSIEHETTKEDIKALLNDDGSIDARTMNVGELDGRRPAPKVVSAAECREWRGRMRDGEPQKAIVAETRYSQPLVSYHTSGKCGHSGVADE